MDSSSFVDDYYLNEADLEGSLDLMVLARLDPEPRFYQRHENLNGLNPNPHFSERLFNFVQTSEMAVWVVGLGDGGEEFPVAIGIAERCANATSEPVLLAGPEEVRPPGMGETGLRPIETESFETVLSSLYPDGCGAQTSGIQGVFRTWPGKDPLVSPLQPGGVVIASHWPPDSFSPAADLVTGVVLVVPFRDQSAREIEERVTHLRSSGYPMLGMVTIDASKLEQDEFAEDESLNSHDGEILETVGAVSEGGTMDGKATAKDQSDFAEEQAPEQSTPLEIVSPVESSEDANDSIQNMLDAGFDEETDQATVHTSENTLEEPAPPIPIESAQSESEIAESVTAEPELAAPIPIESAQSEPEVTEPVAAEPELVEPESVEPEVAEPELVEPEPVEPEVAEPVAAEPELVEPEPVEPEVAELVAAEPELVEPESVEPEVAAPVATESESASDEQVVAEESAPESSPAQEAPTIAAKPSRHGKRGKGGKGGKGPTRPAWWLIAILVVVIAGSILITLRMRASAPSDEPETIAEIERRDAKIQQENAPITTASGAVETPITIPGAGAPIVDADPVANATVSGIAVSAGGSDQPSVRETSPAPVAREDAPIQAATVTSNRGADTPSTAPAGERSGQIPEIVVDAGPPFAVLCGSFKSLANAKREVARLKELGEDARLISVQIPNKGVWHRVIIGRESDLEITNELAHKVINQQVIAKGYIVSGNGLGSIMPLQSDTGK